MDLVEEATQAFNHRDHFWPGRLARNLENKQRGLSVIWSLRCVEALLEFSYQDNKARWLPYLNDAKASLGGSYDGEHLYQAGMELYYLQNRGRALTALKNIYAAVNYYHHLRTNEAPTKVGWSIGPIMTLFSKPSPMVDEWHENSRDMFEICLRLHDELFDGARPVA
jgi:hypothetical protein